MRKHVAAFTEIMGGNYPAYISINDDAGTYTITMRQRGTLEPIVLEISEFDLSILAEQIIRYLDIQSGAAL